jgi:hypothetical protein
MNAQALRLVPLLLLTCSPLILRCGGATNPTETATETGNPPAIVRQKLSMVENATGVELRGDAGAVTPAATVTVTNRTTGERGEAIALGDGSVSVIVAGSLRDGYEVTVSNTAGAQTVLLFSDGDGKVVESDTLSCQDLNDRAGRRASQTVMGAARTCGTDADCTFVSWHLRCVPDCDNRYDSISSTAADQFNAELRGVENAFCGDFESRNCFVLQLPCTGPTGADTQTRPACVDGQCTILRE